MSVNWTIGGQSLAALGLEVAAANFRTGAASELILRRVAAFDAAPLYAYDQALALVREGETYFAGKVKSRPAWGRDAGEGQMIRVADAWQDLEDTVYQEPWSIGSGSAQYPMAVLGIDSTGASITSGQQIREAITYAISAGVDLQLGSVPDGLPLWPSEVRNASCAEVIRLSLRFSPDWVPWIDHSTTPPTFNVTARAALDVHTASVAGDGDVESFSIQRRDDLKPASVRIVYTNATIIEGVTYRDHVIDKWPVGGPDQGPRVLSSVIELAGGQMQFQKSRIQTRTLPTDQATAKTWLKLKFPHLKDVPDAHMAVSGFSKELLEETEEHPDPVNPRAERLEVDDATDLPRELVRGTVEDWMRKKVGKIRISARVRPAAGASAASKTALAKGLPPVTVTATDAVTKIYKGVTSWVAPESAPAGIAQAVYESLEAYQFEGDVTLVMDDVSAIRWHGAALNLTGGLGEWATMKAMVHQASVDIGNGSVAISFGPPPFLAAEDFLELQRLLRGRRPTWTSQEERVSNELGAEFAPGSKGDTVSGYDQPETLADPVGAGGFSSTVVPEYYTQEGEGESAVWKVAFTKARFWEQSLHTPGTGHDITTSAGKLTDDSEENPRPELELETGPNEVWLKFGIEPEGKIKAEVGPDPGPAEAGVELIIGAKPAETQYEPARPTGGDVAGTHVQKVGVITVPEDGSEPVWEPECTSARLDIFEPEIEHVGGGNELFYEYRDGRDRWRTIIAGLLGTEPGAGEGQISVTTEGDVLLVRGNSLDSDFQFVESGASSPAEGEEIGFRDGLNIDGEVPGEEPLAPKKIILPVVAAGAGIAVTRGGPGNRTFTVAATGGGGDNFNIRRYVRNLNINFGTESIELGSIYLASSLYVRNGLVSRTDPADLGIPDWDFFEYSITHSS
jgi:hypothetical protein